MFDVRVNVAKACRVVLPVLCCLGAAGCGESLPRTIPVHGKVTWQGKPLGTGSITFQPVESELGTPLRPACGCLNPDGTYRLSTFRTHDGAMPGQYAVVITSYTTNPPVDPTAAPPKWLIPEKYGRTDASGLSATISPDASGELELDFDLPLKAAGK
jgi:hypothetical protein